MGQKTEDEPENSKITADNARPARKTPEKKDKRTEKGLYGEVLPHRPRDGVPGLIAVLEDRMRQRQLLGRPPLVLFGPARAGEASWWTNKQMSEKTISMLEERSERLRNKMPKIVKVCDLEKARKKKGGPSAAAIEGEED